MPQTFVPSLSYDIYNTGWYFIVAVYETAIPFLPTFAITPAREQASFAFELSGGRLFISFDWQRGFCNCLVEANGPRSLGTGESVSLQYVILYLDNFSLDA